MAIVKNQNCPLCDSQAEYEFADRGNQKHFYCDQCTEFRISIGAEKRLSSSTPEWRYKSSEMAQKCNGEEILVIILPPAGALNQSLVAEFVSRKK